MAMVLGIGLCSLQLCPVWDMEAPLHIHTSRREKDLCGTPEAGLRVLGRWHQGPVTTKLDARQLHFPQNCLLKGAPCWQGTPEVPGSHRALSQAPVLGSNTLLDGQTLCVSDLRVLCPSFGLTVLGPSAVQEQPTWHLCTAAPHTTGCAAVRVSIPVHFSTILSTAGPGLSHRALSQGTQGCSQCLTLPGPPAALKLPGPGHGLMPSHTRLLSETKTGKPRHESFTPWRERASPWQGGLTTLLLYCMGSPRLVQAGSHTPSSLTPPALSTWLCCP